MFPLSARLGAQDIHIRVQQEVAQQAPGGAVGHLGTAAPFSAHNPQAQLGVAQQPQLAHAGRQLTAAPSAPVNVVLAAAAQQPHHLPSHSGGIVQGDISTCAKPPFDFKSKVLFWPGLPWPGQARAELQF